MKTHLFVARPAVRAAAVACFALLASSEIADAQRRSLQYEPPLAEVPGVPEPARPKRGFNLLGNADIAGTGLRMSGTAAYPFSNFGICQDVGVLFSFFNASYCSSRISAAGFLIGGGYELMITAAAPRHEFRKIRNLYPGVSAALGAGYTHQVNYGGSVSGPNDFGPADNTIGVLFSGVTSTEGDNSCRDHSGFSGNYMNPGVSLLAGSDCPETWAPGGFDGPRPISEAAYINAFNADRDNFTFDFFRIPQEERDQTRFLGNFSSYSLSTDHYSEQLALFGKVTPKGPDAPPKIAGFPLGLEIRYEAFTSGLPTIANVAFYQLIVVNKSAAVYGAPGVDYDSLYMGMQIGFGNTNGQSNSYYEPQRNAVLDAGVGTSGACAAPRVYFDNGTGPCATTGFASGAQAIIMLKSPIGDTRNKLLSKPGPFFNPGSKYADDTITFNHGHKCGYGGCALNTWAYSERSGFGLVSSTEENVLDGRSAAEFHALGPTTFFRTFRNFDWPNITPKFTRFAVPGWDYNNDDIPDTLKLDTCHVNGCVKTWADTMPGRQVNRYGNTGGQMQAGPFKLGSGDTTSFIFALVGAPDSLQIEAFVNNAIDYYMNFYLGPEAAPAPTITAVEAATVQDRDTLGLNPFVTLYLGNEPEVYQDKFLANFASAVGSQSNFAVIRARNPGIADVIQERADQNLQEVLIYKSCDNGRTWTDDTDCAGDPAVDLKGQPIGPGWRPYATIPADEVTGFFEKVYTDNSVIGGVTYLYSTVTRTRGLTLTIRDSTDAGEIAREFVVAGDVYSGLATSGPTTARVYVPITRAAGSAPATVNTLISVGRSSVPVDVRFSQKVVGGTYKLHFGNRFQVRIAQSNTTARYRSRVVAEDVVANALQGTTTKTNFVTDSIVLADTGLVQTSGERTGESTVQVGAGTATTADDSTVTTFTISGLGVVLANGNTPLFVSTTLTSTGTTPAAFIGSARFPGFVVSLDTSILRTGAQRQELLIKPPADTVQRAVLDAGGVQVREAETTRRNGASGVYEFTFQSDPYGPGAPFTINATDVPSLQSAVTTSLLARPSTTRGNVTPEVRAILAAQVTGFPSTAELVPVKFPFSVTNSTFGNRPVILAAIRRQSYDAARGNTVLFGQNNDTARVQVADSLWVPGDQFYVLEIVQRDDTVGTATRIDANGKPIQITDTVVTLGPVSLGCNTPRATCNPLRLTTPGATGYLTYPAGTKLVVEYYSPFTLASEITLNVVSSALAGAPTKRSLSQIRAVPNPFIVQSIYDAVAADRVGEPRILFTGVPQSGVLRIYSLSGQFLQQLDWTPADLNGTGDLQYNLRTREGTDLASGLYIFVVTTTEGGRRQVARGKFVIIR